MQSSLKVPAGRGREWLFYAVLLGFSAVPAIGADPAVQTSPLVEIVQLRRQLAEQKQRIHQLEQALDQQGKWLDQISSRVGADASPLEGEAVQTAAPLAEVARTLPSTRGEPASLASAVAATVPLPEPIPHRLKAEDSSDPNPCEPPRDDNRIPPWLRIGDVCIAPVGFLDLTAVRRDKNSASGIGSNFGSIPFSNSVNGNLSEFRFSPQNSRLGLRVDGAWRGARFIGYSELDFLGTSGSNSLTVTNGAFVPRLRLFWLDLRKGQLEFVAGQSWSMLTPGRKGISPLPRDLFYTQVIDVNYMAGLTWTRQAGARVLYHFHGEKATLGLSFENPDQYMGGSAGGSPIVLPSAYAALAGTQLDNAGNLAAGNTVLAVPAVAPDIIAKIAVDTSSRLHLELAAVGRKFKIVNPSLLHQKSTATGGGLQFGLNAQVIRNTRFVSTNFWSAGGGRYLFGQAPDVIVRGDGKLSPIHSAGTINGIETTIRNTLFYGYYGGIYVGRNTSYDSESKRPVGYGFAGSPDNQNRTINELSFGFNQTLWENPRYGALNLMGQYEWLQRKPWFVAPGASQAARDNTVYLNFRYTLPGAPPPGR